ncbi:MAG: ABC transporter substrate-binding protein [Candidatus Nanopelagicales bacterium]
MPRARAWSAAVAAGAVAALVVLGVVGAPAQAISSSPPPSGSSSSSGPVLRVGMTSGIDNPNIWALNSATEFEAVTLQYDMLMKYSDVDLTAAPGIATGCDPNADRTVWTCKIRPGLKWSDGVPLTSKDVAFSYKFAIDKEMPYFSGYFPEGTTFETPDDTTLIWKSPTPTNGPNVPAWVYVAPEHVWAKYADKDLKEITSVKVLPNVASGPFVMTTAVDGQSWTFERNPNFWGPKPAYQTIVFQLFTNQEAMVQALKNGQIDIADGLEPALLPAVEKLSNVAIQKVVSDWWVNMAFNFGGQGPASKPLPALQDLQVRKAIEMAIDKQKIVDTVYPGAASPGETVVRPLSVYWHLDVPDDKVVKYDPQAANALLDQAGYPKGADGVRTDPKTGQPLVMRMPTSDDTQGSTAVGQLIAGFLKQIGITVKVQPVTAGKMYDIQQSGDFDAYIWYWSGDPDPNYQLSVFTSGSCKDLSDGCFTDPAYDALFEKQNTTLDPEQRLPIVKEAQQYLYDHIPGIVVAYPNAIEAYRTDKVTGLTATPAKVGYLMPSYVYTSMVTAKPAEASASGSGSSSSGGIPVWVWAAVAAVVVVGAVLLLRRRGAGDDEAETD